MFLLLDKWGIWSELICQQNWNIAIGFQLNAVEQPKALKFLHLLLIF